MKWSIIRVGIVTLFMGLVTSVLGMTEDDRQQRRAERHQRKLQQYKSGWNRMTPEVPERAICRFDGIAFPWRGLGLRAKETVGNGDHVRLDSSFFFQQGESDVHVETKLRAVGG